MTTIEHGPGTMPFARPALSAGILAALGKAFRHWRNRRTLHDLHEMTDVHLADIGLRRADLHIVCDMSFGDDPTRRLGIIAKARATEALARQVS